MKTTVSLLASASILVITAATGYSAAASPAGFEQRKAEQINRIDNRIKQLQDEKTCISAASTREAIKTCRERAKPAQKPGRL